MDLRSELLPPRIEQRRIEEVSAEIDRVDAMLSSGRRTEAEQAIAVFDDGSGHEYEPVGFLDLCGRPGIEEFALEAARPAWPRVDGVSRGELIEIVGRIQAGGDDAEYYLLLFRANVPHPHIVDLIFCALADLADGSVEAIVDAALAYRPTAL